MKIGAGIGYTSGALYKRHKNAAYTPGSKYERFGKFGLLQQRNLRAMNREAVSGYNASFTSYGANLFALKVFESQGYSEIAANKVLERVRAQMDNLIDNSSALSLANGGNGGENTGETGTNVDESA